jgi:hypothetical protein
MEKESYTRSELQNFTGTLPDQGPLCPRCQTRVPQFEELSEADETRVRQLIREGRAMMAMQELLVATGCPFSWAKI